MSNYIDDERMCRVDLFKGSGKWYTTISIKWEDYKTANLKEYLKQSVKDQSGEWEGFTAVCLHPYSQFSHPIMVQL
jgi:hypothetical protein